MTEKIIQFDELKKRRQKKNKDNYDEVFQLKITLKGVKPSIWRVIQVPANYTFWDLHCAIQDAMGWYDAHLHEFVVKNKHIATPGDDMMYEILNERKEKIADHISEGTQSFEYIYDFGDGWEHKVALEKILPRENGASYPRCLKGERACPPEDCGGVWGYEDLLGIIKDPDHEEYEEMMGWLGVEDDEYDPEYFDPYEIYFYDPEKAWKDRM